VNDKAFVTVYMLLVINMFLLKFA